MQIIPLNFFMNCKIMPRPIKTGLEFYYIEQGGNFTESSMRSTSFSTNYFKDNLEKYFLPVARNRQG